MRLDIHSTVNYLTFFYPQLSKKNLAIRAEKVQKDFKMATPRLFRFIEFGERSEVRAAGFIENFHADFYAFFLKKDPGHPESGEEIIQDVILRSGELGAGTLAIRVEVDEFSEITLRQLERFQFKRVNTRIEFRSPLSQLPDETGTPITWRPLLDTAEIHLSKVGDILKACSKGDPDFSESDNAIELIKGYLNDPVLSNDPRKCIHIGYYEGKVFGIIVAQVNPKSRWSTITYMGMLPEFRGKGLGRWVHRHGFTMLRGQGGELYHGGTVEKNKAMLKLFETNNCQFYKKFEEWQLDLKNNRNLPFKNSF